MPDAIDHDRLFKELLTAFFAEFVALFLPDVAAYLDQESITFLDKEVFSDVTSGEKHEADIVVRARFQNEDAFFLVHIENQAKAQAEFGRRMFRYFARLHEKHALSVYPVVLFSFDQPRRQEPSRYTVTFPGFTPLRFAYRTIQLNRLHWRDFLRIQNPVAAALMAKMDIAPRDRPRVKLECLRLLATLKLDPARTKLIGGFIDTYLRLSAAEMRRYEQAFETLAEQERRELMVIETDWHRKGRVEGRQEEASTILLRLLRRRFQEVPSAVEETVLNLPTETLEEMADALFDFTDIDAAEAWLKRHATA